MNILFISNDALIAETESPVRLRMRAYAGELVRQTAADSTLHVLTRASKTEVITDGPLVVHAVRVSALQGMMRLENIAHDLIKKESIALVSAQDPFEYGRIALHAVRGTSAKLHIQVHTDFLSPWFTRSGNFRSAKIHMPLVNRIRVHMAKKVLMKANGIRVVSERIKASLLSRYGSRIVVPSVIPIKVAATLPPREPLSTPYPFTLMTISRLEPEKRIEDILLALHTISGAYPAVGLVIVGDGRERKKLEDMVRTLRLDAKVQFLGWQNNPLGLLQSAQCYIQASAYEGYGMTLIEAALARVPIITTDVGVVGEVFRGYEELLAAPPGDPAALATHIRGLLEDNATREVFREKAYARAIEHLASQEDVPARIISDILHMVHE